MKYSLSFPHWKRLKSESKFLFSYVRINNSRIRFNEFSKRFIINLSIFHQIKTLNRYKNQRYRAKTYTRYWIRTPTLVSRQFANSLDLILKRYSILHRKWCKTALERKWGKRLGLNERIFARMSDSSFPVQHFTELFNNFRSTP